MIVVYGPPPIFGRVRAAMGPDVERAWFTWGDTIYAPSGEAPPPEIVAHEGVHRRQQAASGPATWWDRWLADPAWRLRQEIAGYGAQYAYLRDYQPRRARGALDEIERIVAGPLYGYSTDWRTARTLILLASARAVGQRS